MPKPSEFSSTGAPGTDENGDPTGILGSEWVIIEKGGTTYKIALSRIKEYYAANAIPPDAPGRPSLLNQKRITGEGGYRPHSYLFRCKTSVYFKQGADHGPNGSFASSFSMLPEIFNTTTHPDVWSTETVDGVDYDVASDVVRVSTGNNNVFVMLTDGSVSVPDFDLTLGYGYGAFTTPYSTTDYTHTWIANNYTSMKDMFCPSDYNWYFTQLVLMSDGKLRSLPLLDTTAMQDPPEVMTNVDRILTVNQGHARDCIVAKNDNTVWHVVLSHGGTWWTGQITGMEADKIETISLGDDDAACRVVWKDDLNKAYGYGQARSLNEINPYVIVHKDAPHPINWDQTEATIDQIKMVAAASTTADTQLTFPAGENIIELQGNEIQVGAMTTSRLRVLKNHNGSMLLNPPSVEDITWGANEVPKYLPVATGYAIIYTTSTKTGAVVGHFGTSTADTGYFPLIETPPC